MRFFRNTSVQYHVHQWFLTALNTNEDRASYTTGQREFITKTLSLLGVSCLQRQSSDGMIPMHSKKKKKKKKILLWGVIYIMDLKRENLSHKTLHHNYLWRNNSNTAASLHFNSHACYAPAIKLEYCFGIHYTLLLFRLMVAFVGMKLWVTIKSWQYQVHVWVSEQSFPTYSIVIKDLL